MYNQPFPSDTKEQDPPLGSRPVKYDDVLLAYGLMAAKAIADILSLGLAIWETWF